MLIELAAEIESLREQSSSGHSKRVCALRASGLYGRYVRLSKTGKPAIDAAKVKAAERLDGKFVVHSNDDTLSAEDMALGYKQLQRVEEGVQQDGTLRRPPNRPASPIPAAAQARTRRLSARFTTAHRAWACTGWERQIAGAIARRPLRPTSSLMAPRDS